MKQTTKTDLKIFLSMMVIGAFSILWFASENDLILSEAPDELAAFSSSHKQSFSTLPFELEFDEDGYLPVRRRVIRPRKRFGYQRSPASDLTETLKQKLKDYERKKKKKKADDYFDGDNSQSPDLSFRSHESVEHDGDGVTVRLSDQSFEEMLAY